MDDRQDIEPRPGHDQRDQCVPDRVQESVGRLIARYGNDEQRQPGISLWLVPSWSAARALGIGENEYLRWIRLGWWDFHRDPATRTTVLAFRALAGERAWLLAAVGYTVATATTAMEQDGRDAVLDAAETLVALAPHRDALSVAAR